MFSEGRTESKNKITSKKKYTVKVGLIRFFLQMFVEILTSKLSMVSLKL